MKHIKTKIMKALALVLSMTFLLAFPPVSMYAEPLPATPTDAEYPPKIAESEIKPVSETGEIVLSRVVIPEFVIVHDGVPTDPTARDYYIRYRDYIKNVASSEIYSTWPEDTIRANVLAIMSFTLNRVYTEWCRDHHLFVVLHITLHHIRCIIPRVNFILFMGEGKTTRHL